MSVAIMGDLGAGRPRSEQGAKSYSAHADNVFVALEPVNAALKSTLIDTSAMREDSLGPHGARWGRVVSSGPGRWVRHRYPRVGKSTLGVYDESTSVFIPNESSVGDRVLIDRLAGDLWEHNTFAPRHNLATYFDSFGNERIEMRVVRQSEILAVDESDV